MTDGAWATGRRGEELAADYLRSRGWKILSRNFRDGSREIDLVASRGATIAFVEVKTRATRTGGAPLEPIGWSKRRKVAAAARRWIYAHGRPGTEYRFDAIGVSMGAGGVEIEHIPDAWRLG